jgi:molybdopterin/thiamine biosynthesis adenylyltransferase
MTKGGEHDTHRARRAAAGSGVRDPEGPLITRELPAPDRAGSSRTFRLRPSIEPFAGSDGHLYILRGGATAEFVLRDATERDRALLAALDGPPVTVDEILGRVAATREQVNGMLTELAAAGLLSEADAEPVASPRYDRQLAWLADNFATAREVEAAQARLRSARVAILGCGGLGTWTAAALACVGIGCLVLVDDDTVELSNLNRQILFAAADVGRPKVDAAADWLRRFDPSLSVATRATRLRSAAAVAEVTAGCDFVVETADWPMYELPRWVDRACRGHGIPHIGAAQHPPVVRIGPLRVPDRSPCLECTEAQSRERYPLSDELAAFRSARSRPAPTLGPASGLVGTLIATEILHALTRVHAPATLNRSLVFRLDTFETRLHDEPAADCPHAARRAR